MAQVSRTVASPTVARAHSPHRVSIVALVLGVASTVVCALGSWVPSLWGDEATSVLSAERPLSSLFLMLGRVDAVHGTYYFFLHFWVGAFGSSPFAVRFPSAVAVGIAVAGIVVLGTRLANFRTGIFAGIICLVLPRMTYAGEEARGYAFSAALAVWLTLALVTLLQNREAKRRYWIAYAVGVALCAYVFLFSLLIVVAHALVVLSYRRRGVLRAWAIWTGVGLAAALPIIGFGFFQRSQIAFLNDRTAATFTSVFVDQWFGTSLVAVLCWAGIVAVIAWQLTLWVRAGRLAPPEPNSPPNIVLIGATWLLVPAVILLTVNFVDAIYSSRYLTFAAPAAALLLGALLGRIRPIGVAAVLTAAFLVITWPAYQSQRTPYAKNSSDWAQVADVISANAHPGDGMLFDEHINPSKRPRLGMRVYPSAYVGLVDIALKKVWWKTDYWSDSTYSLGQISHRLDGISTVWLTEYHSPGSSHSDSYDRTTLKSMGYHTVNTFRLHSDVVFELHRP